MKSNLLPPTEFGAALFRSGGRETNFGGRYLASLDLEKKIKPRERICLGEEKI